MGAKGANLLPLVIWSANMQHSQFIPGFWSDRDPFNLIKITILNQNEEPLQM